MTCVMNCVCTWCNIAYNFRIVSYLTVYDEQKLHTYHGIPPTM